MCLVKLAEMAKCQGNPQPLGRRRVTAQQQGVFSAVFYHRTPQLVTCGTRIARCFREVTHANRREAHPRPQNRLVRDHISALGEAGKGHLSAAEVAGLEGLRVFSGRFLVQPVALSLNTWKIETYRKWCGTEGPHHSLSPGNGVTCHPFGGSC